MIQQTEPIDVQTAIDNAPLGWLQARVFILCAMVALFDGFDTQSLAFVLPVLADDWGIDGKQFGPVFSAALAGYLLGQLGLSMLADRVGRRIALALSTVIFGGLTFAAAFAWSWESLLVLRFLAGLGLGGAIPNIMALSSEFAPKRIRATVIATVFGGFALGAVLGGLISIPLIREFGWPVVFVLGGAVPLLLAPLIWFLPESPMFLLHAHDDKAKLHRVMSALLPGKIPADAVFVPGDRPTKGGNIFALFRDGRALTTSLLWATFFLSLMVIYFLFSWLPFAVKEGGASLDVAITASIVLNLGGILGGIILGRLIDRFQAHYVLATAFILGSGAIAALGAAGSDPARIMVAAFFAGACTVGTQTAISAFATVFYPTIMRSTGIGSALAFGRIGAVIGPTAGGILLSTGRPLAEVFAIVAAPPILSTLIMLFLGHRVARTRNRAPQP